MVNGTRAGLFHLEGLHWPHASLVFLLHLQSTGQPEALHPQVNECHAEDANRVPYLRIHLYPGLRDVGFFHEGIEPGPYGSRSGYPNPSLPAPHPGCPGPYRNGGDSRGGHFHHRFHSPHPVFHVCPGSLQGIQPPSI